MIVGHKEIIEKFESLLQNKKLANTLLFSGSAGIGKKLVAKRLSRAILSEVTDLTESENSQTQLFDAGTHPDFYFLDCLDKQQVNVENIRTVLGKLSLKSFASSNRVVLFDNAEYLSIAAANILLKSLEEPKSHLYYILVSANPSRLPQTVLSRCQTWYFKDLSAEEIEKVLSNDSEHSFNNLSPEEQKQILEIVPDSLSAITAVSDNYELWQETNQLLEGILKNKVELISKDLKNLIKDRESLSTVLFFMQLVCRKNMHIANNQADFVFWSQLLDNLLASRYYIFDRNLNAAYLLNQILINAISDDQIPIEKMITV